MLLSKYCSKNVAVEGNMSGDFFSARRCFLLICLYPIKSSLGSVIGGAVGGFVKVRREFKDMDFLKIQQSPNGT